MNLRAHHLLCTVLYEGKGYSQGFVENMDKAVELLRKGSSLTIKRSPDLICSHCPNKQSDGGCALDSEKCSAGSADHSSKESHTIKDLDSYILDTFGIEAEKEYYSKDLYKLVADNISEEIFETSCSSCRWYKQGLCSYDTYKERLNYFI